MQFGKSIFLEHSIDLFTNLRNRSPPSAHFHAKISSKNIGKFMFSDAIITKGYIKGSRAIYKKKFRNYIGSAMLSSHLLF